MQHIDEFPHDVTENPDLAIILPDGCRLSARVWMPRNADISPVPAILEFLPYRKRDGTIVRDQFTHPWFAGHGYACLRVDMRGHGDSHGLGGDEYDEQEMADALDVIAWITQQPWCNGNVGMMGISWGGFNGLQVAHRRPPALKAVITICSTVDRYGDDIHYKGGCLLIENFGWASNMLSYSSRPPDPALVGDQWLEMWKTRLDNQVFDWSLWSRHQHRDAYWKPGSVCEDYSSIKAAVLSIGGWHDGYRNTIAHLVENLDAPVKGIVGPWNHKYPHYAGPRPAIGFLQEAKRWWDRWLKAEQTGVEDDPAYRAYLMDSQAPKRWFDERPGRWVAETQWPSPHIENMTLFLNSSQQLTEIQQTFETTICSPCDCGVQSGEYFPFAFGDELPGDQTADDAVSACFDSAPFSQETDIVGAPRVTIRANADKTTGQLCIRLCDLRPDGSSAFITYGVLNLTHRSSHEFPEPLKPGEDFEISVALDQIAYRIPANHRLRVAVSSAYWPFMWPSPERTSVTLKSGELALPVRPTASEDEWHFEEPQSAPAWKCENLRPSSYERQCFEQDGYSVTEIFADSGENRDLEHGLISGSWAKERWTIKADDPLSARGAAQWEQTGGRPGQMWRTLAETETWCDRTHFHAQARLRCWLEGEIFSDRSWEDSVERQLV